MENFLLGFDNATTLNNLLWCFIGVTLGTIVGVIPGIGTLTTVSLLLPISYHLGDPIASIIFLAGIYYGSQYGGSITSILLRIPGEVSSTVTIVDGGAMAKKGRAGSALTIAALSSFIGGTFSTIIIALLATYVMKISFLFGPAEYASLMLLGVLSCVVITQKNIYKGLAMVALGAFLGCVGTNVNNGETRFTLGISYLIDGIPFAILAIGIYGIAEILYLIFSRENSANAISPIGSLYPTKNELKESIAPTARGTIIGSILGCLPGGGPVISSFLSYGLEKIISKKPKQFGKGAVAGVAGPEAANNSAAQTCFLPTLALGVPITPVMAMIMAALILNGVQPGPNVMIKNPLLFWSLIASMWIGNLFLIILNIPLVRLWVKILLIPRFLLYPGIFLVAILGAYSIRGQWFDVVLLGLCAMAGLVLKFKDFELTPLAMSFVIAPLFEEYFLRALTISRGDYNIFLQKPISLSFLIIAVIFLLYSIFYKYHKKNFKISL